MEKINAENGAMRLDSPDVTVGILLAGALVGAAAGYAKYRYTKKEVEKNDLDLAKFDSNRFIEFGELKNPVEKGAVEKEAFAVVAAGIAALITAAVSAAVITTKGAALGVGADTLRGAYNKGLNGPVSDYLKSDRSIVADGAMLAGSSYALYKAVNSFTDKKMLKDKKNDYLEAKKSSKAAIADEVNYLDKNASVSDPKISFSSLFSFDGRKNIGEALAGYTDTAITGTAITALLAGSLAAAATYSLSRRAMDSNHDTSRLRKLGKIRKQNKTGIKFNI